MSIRPFYHLHPEQPPFILFNVDLNGRKLSCVGLDWHCCDSTCNCSLSNIMIHDADTGEKLTQLIYGWQPFKYYLKEGFIATDARSFTRGMIDYAHSHDKEATAILQGFQRWLSLDKDKKDRLFENRYEEFKLSEYSQPMGEMEKIAEMWEMLALDAMMGSDIFEDLMPTASTKYSSKSKAKASRR